MTDTLTAPALRIGSLCSGYGGLDMAVQQVLGGTVAWHCQYDPDDRYQYAAQILAHHWPEVPNHGDITAIDFTQVEPVDVLTAGFPCQDVSLAGLRAGIAKGTRSGLWLHVARAIRELRPRLVVIENVRGLLSSQAHSNVEPCTWCVGDAGGEPPLRALGAVLGDLADLGFDAEWSVVRASDVGAPHQRERVFLLAWPRDTPADADNEGTQRAGQARRSAERHAAGEDREPADAAGQGLEVGRQGRAAQRGPAAEDADGAAGGERRESAPGQAESRGARADAGRRGGVPDAGRRGGKAPADAEGNGRHEGRPQPTGQQGRSDVAECGSPDIQWGDYESAVRRWEYITGRSAPSPVDDRGRLSPAFVEWLMGLSEGHVVGVPGLTRSARLKALGNGVVPQQAAAALALLVERAGITASSA